MTNPKTARTSEEINPPADARALALEWSRSATAHCDLEPLWEAPRQPDDIRVSLMKFAEYKREVQLACTVDARVVAPTAQNYEKYFMRFNEGFIWDLGDREIFIGVAFSEHGVSISMGRRPKS